MITVVNRRSTQDGLYVGRPSLLGNPFVMHGEDERVAVIERYREHLRHLYRTDRRVRDLLMDLAHRHRAGEHIRLVCWCAPRACHADVIKDAVEKIASTL